LKGWRQIAEFLGQPVSTAQRWAKSGMPVSRQRRSVHASPEELNRWLGREDLSTELRRALSYVRKRRRPHANKAA